MSVANQIDAYSCHSSNTGHSRHLKMQRKNLRKSILAALGDSGSNKDAEQTEQMLSVFLLFQFYRYFSTGLRCLYVTKHKQLDSLKVELFVDEFKEITIALSKDPH